MTNLRLPDPGINLLFFISKNIVSSSACSFQDNLSPSTKFGVSVIRSHFRRRTKHEKSIARNGLKKNQMLLLGKMPESNLSARQNFFEMPMVISDGFDFDPENMKPSVEWGQKVNWSVKTPVMTLLHLAVA